MQFGARKCKLLISGRLNKTKAVKTLLANEPEILTFYGSPVKTVEDYYVHIGVPQAAHNQSKVIVDYRITKSEALSYKLQSVTKNSVSGISPLSNRKMFTAYHQPTFLYGTDTLFINVTDLEKLERKYRKVLRCMLSLPDCAPSAGVYLCMGLLPASAHRDIDILALFGQLAVCDDELQSVKTVIENSLTFYGITFNGWSGLVRQTCLKYNLPDPLQYLLYPWRPDRWRNYCKGEVEKFWNRELLDIVENTPSLCYMDTGYASTSVPMRIWQMAGLDSVCVRAATVVNWFVMGIYFTREMLHKMKKVDSPMCLGCPQNKKETPEHFILECSYFQDIRESFLPKFVILNPNVSQVLGNENLIMLMILDPLSSKLPEEVTNNWVSVKEAYKISRTFVYNMHRKREKYYNQMEKKNS